MARGAARASAVAPIPPKEHSAILFVEKRRLDLLDRALVVVGNSGARRHIPTATSPASCWSPALASAMRAVALAAGAGTLVAWVGEASVRPPRRGADLRRTIRPAALSSGLALDERARLKNRAKNVFGALWRSGSRATIRRAVARHGGRGGKRLFELHARESAVNRPRRDHARIVAELTR